MPEPAAPALGDSLTTPSFTWRGGRREYRAHYPSRVPCVLRPAVWMAQETGLT